jgi:hypothetical protein
MNEDKMPIAGEDSLAVSAGAAKTMIKPSNNGVHRSESGWKFFGGSEDESYDLETEGYMQFESKEFCDSLISESSITEGDILAENSGVKDFLKLVRSLEEMQDSIAQVSAER